MKLNIVCIPGDGIGPEIVNEAKKFWMPSEQNSDMKWILRIF